MRKIWLLCALALMLLCPLATGRCEEAEARDIAAQCKFTTAIGAAELPEITDGNLRTYWVSKRNRNQQYLEVALPEGETCSGLFIRWRYEPVELRVQTLENGEWVTRVTTGGSYYAAYIPLPGLTAFRLIGRDSDNVRLAMVELSVLSAGRKPDWVQVWKPADRYVDLLLVSAHPDDEVLWFGGLLPLYAGEQGKEVLVVCMAFNSYNRRFELLNSLWSCGVTTRALFAPFRDVSSANPRTIYNAWGGRVEVYAYLTAVLRHYRPLVAVSHDFKGEYGHGAHKVSALALTTAVAHAADPLKYPESVAKYGIWDTPKTYIHLYAENALGMDWKQPLAAFGGQTALEVAQAAFFCHVSQAHKKYRVLDGGEYDNAAFGLYRSQVGLDEAKNDLFEHIGER